MKSILSSIKNDFPASIVVFLVALPLCLGVALASGAPLLSGIIAGIIGGIVVGSLSQSQLSVSGPAAGLAAVVLSSITKLGSFEVFLLAVVIAGLIQLILGVFKSGFIANYIPSNVIKGLLAAIGIILILKQIPHATGFDRDVEDDFSFMQSDGENTFSELLNVLDFFNLGAVCITIVSILILVFWNKLPIGKIKSIPASLVVVVVGVFLNIFLLNSFPALVLDESHFVNIPEVSDPTSFLLLPDFSAVGNYQVWLVAFTIALIASIETLLNLEAIQNLDPRKRAASPNRELVAQGIGNMFSGFIGGIPLTSVIVRSSVNIQAGGRSKLSTILHGVFLVASILFLVPVLNLIPLASLASILIVTGYHLAKVSLFRDMFKKGMDQFIPFVATILAIVFTDLLIGVLIGLTISTFFLLKSNFNNPFILEREKMNTGETMRMELPNQVSFLNKATIKDTLWALPAGSKMIIDARYSNFVDHDVLEIIEDFRRTVSVEKKIKLNVLGLKETYKQDDIIQFVNVLDKEGQRKLTPEAILQSLKEGNERFISGHEFEKYLLQQMTATSIQQSPMAVVLGCIDSRISPDIVFDAGIGDLITIRIAGNIVNDYVLGSVELACQEIGTKLILVMGHSNCGAVASAVHGIKDGHIAAITNKILKSVDACNCTVERLKENPGLLSEVIKLNVTNSIDEIMTKSSYISQRVQSKEIMLVAGYYDTATGIVGFKEYKL